MLPNHEKGKIMKKADKKYKDQDMLEEYDFSSGVRGKYARRFNEGCNIVVLEPDILEVFPDSESVNNALRSLAEIIKKRASTLR